jgi:hypothetical protein
MIQAISIGTMAMGLLMLQFVAGALPDWSYQTVERRNELIELLGRVRGDAGEIRNSAVEDKIKDGGLARACWN